MYMPPFSLCLSPLWLLYILLATTKILVVGVTYWVFESIAMHSVLQDKKRRDVHCRRKEKVRHWHVCLEITALGAATLRILASKHSRYNMGLGHSYRREVGPRPKSRRRSFSSNSKINMNCPKHNRLEEEIKTLGVFYKRQRCKKTTSNGHCNFHSFLGKWWAMFHPSFVRHVYKIDPTKHTS